MINPEDHVPRRRIQVMGRTMSIAEAGQGPPILFIHGNATYSYAWRNIIPHLSRSYRCIAPDLIGMGSSDVIYPSGAGSYRFSDHATYLELLFDLLRLEEPAVVIGHEMGATLGIQWARRRPAEVRGLALIEGVFRITNEATLDPAVSQLMMNMRSDRGEHLVLEENAVIDHYLPMLVLRHLSQTEMDAYRHPYGTRGEARRSLLSWMRQLPTSNQPGPLEGLVDESRLWCAQSQMPKLVIGGNPGHLTPPAVVGACSRWANTRVESVSGLHFLFEDSPARLTALLMDWIKGLPTNTQT